MSIFKDIIGLAAPIIGGFLGGPVGASIGGIVGRTVSGGAPRPQPTYAMQPFPAMNGTAGPGDGMLEVANPVVGAITRGGAMMGRWLIGARGIARNAMGKMVGVMRGTSLFRNKRIIALSKQIGIPAAATALGITAAEVAESFVAESGKRRRTRGITGRDIKCTRRTLGKIRSVQRMIGLPRAASRSRGRPAVAVRCD